MRRGRIWSTMGLAMASLAATTVAGCSSPYSTSAVQATSVDGDTLRLVVGVESGTTVTYPGPCPKARTYPERSDRFELTCSLAPGQAAPRWAVRPAVSKIRLPSIDRPNGGSKLVRTVPGRPGSVALPMGSDPRVRELTADGLAEVQEALRELGFDTFRREPIACADTPDGRWYLGAGPAGTFELANPSRGLIVRGEFPVDPLGGIEPIWDVEHARLIVLRWRLGQPVAGMPVGATVWDYAKGTRTAVDLPWVDPSALGASRQASRA